VTDLAGDDARADHCVIDAAAEVDEGQQEHECATEDDRGDGIGRRPGQRECDGIRDQRERCAGSHQRDRQDERAGGADGERDHRQPGDRRRGQDRQRDPDDDRDQRGGGQADHPASTRRGRR
jgi:hypothetical protein